MSGRRFENRGMRHAAWLAPNGLPHASSRMPFGLVTSITTRHDRDHPVHGRFPLALPRDHRSVQRTSRAAEGDPNQLSLHGRVSPCFLTFPSGHEPRPAGRMGTVLHAQARSALSGLPRLIRMSGRRPQVVRPAASTFWGSAPAGVSSVTWRGVSRHPLACAVEATIRMLTRRCDAATGRIQ